jgi:hypothetical protein
VAYHRRNGILRSSRVTRYLSDYLADDDYRGLQNQLASNPDLGDLMPGSGGFRKLRWGDPRRAKGRRGGLRVIYYYFLADQQIWFMTLYDKDEAVDLTPREMKSLKSAIEAELHARRAERSVRERKPGRTRK